MRIRVHTETGSIYELDRDVRTWQRVTKGPIAGTIRNDGALTQLLAWPTIGIDMPLILVSPSLNDTAGRLVITSNVVRAYSV